MQAISENKTPNETPTETTNNMATDNKQTTNTATPFMGMEAQILADTLQGINKLAARVERLEGLFFELDRRLEEIEDKTDDLP